MKLSPTPRSIDSWKDHTALSSSATRVASALRHQLHAAPNDPSDPNSSWHQRPNALLYDEREGGELRGPELTTASAATRPSITPRRVRKLRTECSKTSEYAKFIVFPCRLGDAHYWPGEFGIPVLIV